MDTVETVTPLVVALAALIADRFPELGGRSIAVSEVDPFNNKTNVPTLPIAVTALLGETATSSKYGGGKIELTQDVMAHFIFEPVKYSRADGAESPFFAFYDYEAMRDRMIAATMKWRSPRGASLAYVALDVESDEFAVYLTFKFRATETWCADRVPPEEEPRAFTITANTCQTLYPPQAC